MSQPDYEDPEVVLRFELLKREVKAIKSYSLASSYMTSTDGWEITIFDEDLDQLRGLELQPVEILVDGQQQVLGRVDMTEIGSDGTALILRGRDYIADLVECNVDPLLKFKDEMTLGEALKYACSVVGITEVLGDDEVKIKDIRTGKKVGGGNGKKHKLKKLSEFKPEPGMGLYELCNRIVARHAATIQPSNKRNTLLLSSPDYKQTPAYSISRRIESTNGQANNVIKATATRDYSRFPTVGLFTGKQGQNGDTRSRMTMQIDFPTLADAFSDEMSSVLDRVFELRGKLARRKPGEPAGLGAGLLYRLLYFRDEDSRNQDQLERAAKRAIAERLKDTLCYKVQLRGHQDPMTGALWSVNTMVNVEDEVCGISEPLWIESRSFTNAGGQGAITELECWRPESFQLGE